MNLSNLVDTFKSGAAKAAPLAAVAASLNAGLTSLQSAPDTTFTGNFTVSGATTILTVDPAFAISGNIIIGHHVNVAGVGNATITANTSIVSQLTGNTGKDGTYVVSAPQTITGQNSLRSYIEPGLLTSIANTIVSLETQMTSFVTSTLTSMPLIAAADALEKKLKTSLGTSPAAGAGDAFKTSTAPAIDVKANLDILHSQVANLAAGNSSVSITEIKAAHTNAAATSSGFATAAAAVAGSIATLQSFAQAKFALAPKSPFVESIMNVLLATPPSTFTLVQTAVEEKVAMLSSKSYATKNPDSKSSVNDAAPSAAPTVDTPEASVLIKPKADGFTFSTVAQFKTDYYTLLATQKDAYQSYYQTVVGPAQAASAAYRDATWTTPTYLTLKNNALSEAATASDKAAYASAKLMYTQSTAYTNLQTVSDTYNTLVSEYNRLFNQIVTWWVSPGGIAANAEGDSSKW